jgi:hypothetical protein
MCVDIHRRDKGGRDKYMRRVILGLNAAVVMFGVAAAIISLSNGIIAALCGVIAALATGASLVLGAWETYLDTPYMTIYNESMSPGPILVKPRGGTFSDGGTNVNFREWLFGKR